MAKSPTQASPASEYDFKITVAKINAALSAWHIFVKWGVIALLARYCFMSIDALAGLDTESNIALKLVTDLKANQWFPYVFGGGCIFYGTTQQREKKNTISRLTSRIKELEERIDPNRTSSGLTTTGDTRPEDE